MFVKLYWLLPAFATLVWLSMLLAMLLYWVIDTNETIYPSQEQGQTIPYISDVGAFRMKPLFISMATITVVFLDLSMIAERWLRHNGRLAPNTSWTEKILSIIAIIAGIVGAVGIICLSILDTYHHPNLHDTFLYVFIAGYVVSAIFICAEYQRLGVKFRKHKVLRLSFWFKLFFILIEVALAIAFGVTQNQDKYNAAAILEWTLALIFTFYVASFVMDLLPAVRTKHHMSHAAVTEMGDYGGPNGYTNGYPTTHTDGRTNGHTNVPLNAGTNY